MPETICKIKENSCCQAKVTDQHLGQNLVRKKYDPSLVIYMFIHRFWQGSTLCWPEWPLAGDKTCLCLHS